MRTKLKRLFATVLSCAFAMPLAALAETPDPFPASTLVCLGDSLTEGHSAGSGIIKANQVYADAPLYCPLTFQGTQSEQWIFKSWAYRLAKRLSTNGKNNQVVNIARSGAMTEGILSIVTPNALTVKANTTFAAGSSTATGGLNYPEWGVKDVGSKIAPLIPAAEKLADDNSNWGYVIGHFGTLAYGRYGRSWDTNYTVYSPTDKDVSDPGRKNEIESFNRIGSASAAVTIPTGTGFTSDLSSMCAPAIKIIWLGSNDKVGKDTPYSTWKGMIDGYLGNGACHTSGKYNRCLIIGFFVNYRTDVNSWMKTDFGANFLDMKAALDDKNSKWATEWRMSDGTHPNELGAEAISEIVYDKLNALGYLESGSGPTPPPTPSSVTTNAMPAASWGYTITNPSDHSTVAVFTNTTASMEWVVPAGEVEYLVVGGGGAGGSPSGGGGGAGAYWAGTEDDFEGGQVTVTVGTGGAATAWTSGNVGVNGGSGNRSTLAGLSSSAITANGGLGGGGWALQGADPSGHPNASTGGAGGNWSGISAYAVSPNGDVDHVAHHGGSLSASGKRGGGGGGGAGGAGSDGSGNLGGAGGEGEPNDITGATVIYAAGGGGGSNDAAHQSAGGSGVGGKGGGDDGYLATAGTTPGSGGGGGGYDGSHWGDPEATGAAGADGIVVLRYVDQPSVAGATVTLSATELTYTGVAQAPTVAKVELNGVTLTKDVHYTVTRATQVNCDTYQITVEGIGDYTGTKSVNWTLAKAALTLTPKTVTLAVGTAVPSTWDYTLTGLKDADAAAGKGVLTTAPTFTTTYTQSSSAGTYKITVNNTPAAANYEVTCETGTLYATGGGGGDPLAGWDNNWGTAKVDADGYVILQFTNPNPSSTMTWNVPAGTVEYLVVGGGGGGGGPCGGGGGGGAYWANTVSDFTGGQVTVTVGTGGVGKTGTGEKSGPQNGVSGGTTTLTGALSITANGGSGGGGWELQGATANAGASTGGTGGHYSGNAVSPIGSGSVTGGSGGKTTAYGGGGGGGAGGNGSNASSSQGAAGGAGESNDITGSDIYYAAGGGGGSNGAQSKQAEGGSNGAGGAGGTKGKGNADSGATPGSGGGGGGYDSKWNDALATGGNGANGIVVLKYLASAAADTWLEEPSFTLNGETVEEWRANETESVTVSMGTASSGGTVSVLYDGTSSEMPETFGDHTAVFTVADSELTKTIAFRIRSENDPVKTVTEWGYTLEGGNVGNRKVFVYTKPGNNWTWTKPAGVTSVRYLIVGGGGGGGYGQVNKPRAGGGGGAGGFAEGSKTDLPNAETPHTVKVGAGGAASDSGAGSDGGDSEFLNVTAGGGGGGGGVNNADGRSGGSGGGTQGISTSGGSANGKGTGSSGGHYDSSVDPSGYGGAGGGGAGGVGANSPAGKNTLGGVGGAGANSTITGGAETYAHGGNGGSTDVATESVWTYAGSGGNGGDVLRAVCQTGTDGQNGIVIVSYETAVEWTVEPAFEVDGETVTSWTYGSEVTVRGSVSSGAAVQVLYDDLSTQAVETSTERPKNVGSYRATFSVPGTSLAAQTIDFTITKSGLTAKPTDVTLTTGSPVPETWAWECLGLKEGDTKETLFGNRSLSFETDFRGKLSRAGTYYIRITDDLGTLGNYTVTKEDGMLTAISGGTGSATFSDVGSTTWTAPTGVTEVEYLIVGGGGGGGYGKTKAGGRGAGGGGAGGVRTGTCSVESGTEYTIVVGDGGAIGSSDSSTAKRGTGFAGGYSSFNNLVAQGGGGGCGALGSEAPETGGSGGGGAAERPGAIGTDGQGNAGGAGCWLRGSDGSNYGSAGGGGGGADGVGQPAVIVDETAYVYAGGAGGRGFTSAISGESVEYARGGAGGGHFTNVVAAANTTPGSGGNGYHLTDATATVDPTAGCPGIVILRWGTASEYYIGGTNSADEVIIRMDQNWAETYAESKGEKDVDKAMNTPNQHGVTPWEAYLQGFDVDKADEASMVAAPVQTASPSALRLTLRDWPDADKQPADSGVTISYQLYTRATQDGYAPTGNPQSQPTFNVELPSSGVRYYRIKTVYENE